MKLLFVLFFTMISNIVFAQQTIKLCDNDRKEYTYYTNSNEVGIFEWDIDGVDQNNNSNSIDIDWSNYSITEHLVTVNFISDNNCESVSESYLVELIDCDITTLYIPNSFTPDKDAINNTWTVYGTNIDQLIMRVFNRWGGEIYYSSNMDYGWDGKYKGIECQNDVYVYYVIYVDNNGRMHEEVGNVTLIR